MAYIQIPDSGERLYDGSVVELSRFPNTKWVVHNGWFTYNGVQIQGWYFSSIPSQTIMPVTQADLRNITIINNRPDGDQCPPCPPGPPMPPIPPVPPMPPVPRHRSIERYYGGTYYKAGQVLYLKAGDLFQAVIDFRSSWERNTAEANMKYDIDSGYLVAVPNEDVPIATADTAGIVKGGADGDINIDAEGDMTIKDESVDKDKLSAEVQETIDNAVQNTRKVNGKALDEDITLTADDIEIAADKTVKAAIGELGLSIEGKVAQSGEFVANHVIVADANGAAVDSGLTIDDIKNSVKPQWTDVVPENSTPEPSEDTPSGDEDLVPGNEGQE